MKKNELKTKEPSEFQKSILDLLCNGWELGILRTGASVRCWMQKGGLMADGKSITVPFSTVQAMEDHKFIKEVPRNTNDQGWLTRFEII